MFKKNFAFNDTMENTRFKISQYACAVLLIVSSIALVSYQVIMIDDVSNGLLVYVAQAFLPPATSSASGTTSEKEAASKKTGSSFGGLGFFSYLCALVRETAHTWPLMRASWLSLNRSLRRQICNTRIT